ncbi:hypothetical protein Taro_022866 [Colocasia esculenta]|uniref:Chorismate mutase n=1 Tax=Colocasia esculenta TaxID=4460 RepID=A0A843V9M5_COLES|nr:hypothetical protein [Colocasia esculenta]
MRSCETGEDGDACRLPVSTGALVRGPAPATRAPPAPPAMASPSEAAAEGPPRPLAAPARSLTLDGVRDALVRQEDTIVFCLIERARFPRNAAAYEPSFSGHGTSLAEFFVRRSEETDAEVGRYQSLEELPIFPGSLPTSLVPASSLPQVLHPKSASVNVNKDIWEMYFHKLLPLFTVKGDDGNYGATLESDLACLQALSRRIHCGRYVAEVKFRDAPQDYTPLILAKDRDALMKLLTFEAVEESVKKRVAKKAMVFGQNVTLDDKNSEEDNTKRKIDPKVVSRLYGDWVMPLTKLVEVEYLLQRLS